MDTSINRITAFADDIPIETSMSFGNQDSQEGVCPKRFVLLKFGKNRYTMAGKDPEEFDFTPDMAQKIIDEFDGRGRDLVIDYDHGTLNPAKYTGDAPASGWVEKMEMDPERGLVAVVKKWQPKATERMQNGEYRYFSPVLMMDKMKKHPNAIQSIALTNHPAIHNLDALVAANDLSNKNARKELNETFKKTISDMRDGLMSCQQLIPITIEEYVKAFADDPEYSKEAKTFTESVLLALADEMSATAPIQAPMTVDITALIQQKKGEFQGQPQKLLDWLTERSASAVDTDEKRKLESERNELLAFKEKNPMLWNAGISSGNESTIQMLQPKPVAPAIPIGLSDLMGESDPDKLVNKVKELNDLKNDAEALLKLHSVESLADLNNKFLEEKNELVKKLNDIEIREVGAKAEKVVSDAITAGKITEAMRVPALEIAKTNMKAFNDFIGKSVNTVAMVSLNSKVSEREAPAKQSEIQAFSDDQLRIAKLYQLDPKEIKWDTLVPVDTSK
jgi:phage I-like protein